MIRSEILPQQVILYRQTQCYNRLEENACLTQYYNAQFYENQTSFNIDPNEEVIIVLRNCGQNWFRHAMTYEMQFVENRWIVTSPHPWQACILIKNHSDRTALHVEEHSTLAALLEQTEIIHKLVHIRQIDLQLYRTQQEQSNSKEEEEEEEEEEEVNEEEEEKEEEKKDNRKEQTNQFEEIVSKPINKES